MVAEVQADHQPLPGRPPTAIANLPNPEVTERPTRRSFTVDYKLHILDEAAARQLVRTESLNVAYAAHPERFVRKPPTAPAIPTAAWINKPATPPEEEPAVSQKILP